MDIENKVVITEGKGREGEVKKGVGDYETQTTVYNKQQESIVQHREV